MSTISASTRKWLKQPMTDHARTSKRGYRLRAYIDVLDFLRFERKWVRIGDCAGIVGPKCTKKFSDIRSQLRQTRRILYTLEATGLVELRVADSPGNPTEARVVWP